LALPQSTGQRNIAIGVRAGYNLQEGDNNLYFGSEFSDFVESNTIRLGTDFGLFPHTRTFIGAVRGVGVPLGIPVLIGNNGQLGTYVSSARFKEEISDMADASSGLLKLRPVSFRYKGQTGGGKQFGLIAEEVQQILPELVVCDPAGEAETVLYHEMPAMLLNELQKQQKVIAELQERLIALESALRDAGVR
jgi:hypothetical protein